MATSNSLRYYRGSILLIASLFITSTHSLWQENVRPKLYIELGKSQTKLAFFLHQSESSVSSKHINFTFRQIFSNLLRNSFRFIDEVTQIFLIQSVFMEIVEVFGGLVESAKKIHFEFVLSCNRKYQPSGKIKHKSNNFRKFSITFLMVFESDLLKRESIA